MKRRLHVHAKHSGIGHGGQFHTTEGHAKARKNSRLRPANGTDGGGGCLVLLIAFFALLIACSRRTVIVENPGTGVPDTMQVKHIIHN